VSTPAPPSALSTSLRSEFGEIDIYLFDQLLKGRFDSRRSILDAGCGSGRNLVYLLRRGFEVFGVDRDPDAIARVRRIAGRIAPQLPADRFQVATVEAMPFADQSMDAVLCSAVLHFAEDEQHFERMLEEMWRVLRPGGFFFARLASTIGIESRVVPIPRGRHRLPDGTERFLVDQSRLLAWTDRLDGALAEPIKTTNVQDLRAMTTWCLHKGTPSPPMTDS
jgi:tellurite methyltransferase